MHDNSAQLYDLLYEGKDYQGEARKLHELIRTHCRSGGSELLDVGIGTGGHAAGLRQWYAVAGLDRDARMLEVAAGRFPDMELHSADMADFALGKRYDAVVCLFGSIGYVKTLDRLSTAVRCMAEHLKPGGVLAIEPFLAPDQFKPDSVHATFVNKPGLKVARMNVGRVKDRKAILDFHYMVGTPQGIRSFAEHHELGLFAHEHYMAAMGAESLETSFDSEGLMGRGLYLGARPTTDEGPRCDSY